MSSMSNEPEQPFTETKRRFVLGIVAIGVIGIVCVAAYIAIGKIAVRPVDSVPMTKPMDGENQRR